MGEVTVENFDIKLPWLLGTMSESSFVSLDLEFSGIPSRNVASSGKQSLQERYTETKHAAEKYQILQIGFTTVSELEDAGYYITRTWRMHLHPLIDSRLNVDRTWSYQSNAISFLLKNGFRMQAPLQEGVPYLSRREEEQAKQHVLERNARSSDLVALDIPESDTESLEFLRITREAIDAWLAKGEKAPGYLNIPPNHGRPELDDVEILEPGLNRFHKRLVHQLVEIEYPSLRSIGRLTFVQIIQYDESREQDVRKARLRLIEERCLQHYGVRWIIEALVRGDLSKLDSNLFGALPFDPRSEKRRAALETAVKIKMKLKRNPPVLVGHNLFVDMVYLWQCFFGYLPERVEDFQSLLHENFPLLIDTKYLATHDCGDINPIASLDKIDESLKDAEKPKIVSRQLLKTGLHEAGYDSYLTAKIFLKLASRLPKEHSIESLDTGRGSVDGSSTSQKVPGAYLDTSEEEDEEDSSTESPPDFAVDIDERNAFDEWGAPDGAPSYYPSDGSDIDVQSESEEESAEKDREILLKIAKGDLIPRFCSDVWKPYSNKLRVFGTNERVIILGDSEPSESSS